MTEQGKGPVMCRTCKFSFVDMLHKTRCDPRLRVGWNAIDGKYNALEDPRKLNADGRCPHYAPTWRVRFKRWLRGAKAVRLALSLEPESTCPHGEGAEMPPEGRMRFGVWQVGIGAWTWVDVRAAIVRKIEGTDGEVVEIILRDLHSQEVVPAFHRWIDVCLGHAMDGVEMEGVWYAELQQAATGRGEDLFLKHTELRQAVVTSVRGPRDPYHLYDEVCVQGYTREAWDKRYAERPREIKQVGPRVRPRVPGGL